MTGIGTDDMIVRAYSIKYQINSSQQIEIETVSTYLYSMSPTIQSF